MSISLGPLVLAWSHVLFILAYLVALVTGWLAGRQRHVSVEPTLTKMLITGLIVARIGFVALYWQDYRRAPLSVFDIRDGGFSIISALAGSILIALYSAWQQRPLRMPLALAIGAGFLVWGLSFSLYSLIRAEQKVPLLHYQTLAGKPASLTPFYGKPLVVNLWATWCPPCRREMPALGQAQKNHPEIHFVFVNQGEFAHTVNGYLQSEGLTLRNVLLDTHQKSMTELGTRGLPSTLFYSADGRLIHAHTGELSHISLKHALKKITTQ